MIKLKHTYILLILTLTIISCKQTKHVPDGKYLLQKNEIVQRGDKLDKSDLNSIIRQQPNYKRFGIKWKLMAFNLVDSTKVAEKRIEKNKDLRIKNQKRIERQERINQRRIERARENGDSLYTKKTIPLKDTASPRMFFREWYKYKIGRPPVIFDSVLYKKSIEQLSSYLRSKGYYYGEVEGSVEFKSNKKCIPTYLIKTGDPYIIDSIYILTDNPLVKERYDKYLSRWTDHPLLDENFDRDLLDDHRSEVAEFMRNEALYGFSSSHISFIADTIKSNLKVKLGVHFGDRQIRSAANRDSLIPVKHQVTHINSVYFHLADTIHYPGSFSKKMDELGLSLYDGKFLRTIDTTYYNKIKIKRSEDLDVSRMAVFLHNGPLYIKPKILESKNYLEMDELYAENKLEKTYLSLLQMDLFQAVKTDLVEIGRTGCVDAHYYLIPSKKQSFSFEPRATNSNGYLGVAATISYTNRNVFRGAEKLVISLSGGFESQPPIFDKTLDGEPIQTAARSFNTFEIGPSTKLELPGLFPIRLSNISKKLKPKTIISTAYNFQKRNDFTKGTFQLNYYWRFFSRKTMIFESGLPGISVIKFVNIEKSDPFDAKLNQLNDVFLLNAYSDQFVWQDWKFTFEYNIKEKERRKSKSQLNFKSVFDPAGNILSLFGKFQDTLDNGQRSIFGIGYSQFARLDNELIYAKPLRNEKSLNFRLGIGGGIPYGNTTTSLPYDYSFFGGGANDNRGWRARSLGPGSYKYYLDTNRTATQIGDCRLSGSSEFRFAISSLFKGAFFVDAGNIWTAFPDEKRIGGQLSGNWYKEIAVAAGVGLRLDFEFFIIRVDFGVPLRNPALPDGAKWIFQKRDAYIAEGKVAFGDDYDKYLPAPFTPNLHFGIGYPF